MGDDDFVGHVDEEAGFDDAGDVVEGEVEGVGVVEFVVGGVAEEAVEVGVAVVGEEGGAVGVGAWGDGGAHGLEFSGDDGAGEFDDFDEDRKVGAEAGDDFFFADDDDEFFGDGGDDFFAGEVAAAAFGEVEVGIDFIGAIDGDVDGFGLFEGGEGDAGVARDLLGEEAGGDADGFEFLIADAAAEGADEGEGRLAGA